MPGSLLSNKEQLNLNYPTVETPSFNKNTDIHVYVVTEISYVLGLLTMDNFTQWALQST